VIAVDWDTVKHFDQYEFRCGCCKVELMDATYIRRLDLLRDRMGFPFEVRSGYRCPEHNDRVSTTGLTGPHTTGHAADIYLFGRQVYELLQFAPAFNMTGLGIKAHGDHNRRFIHLDDLDKIGRPTVWSYA